MRTPVLPTLSNGSEPVTDADTDARPVPAAEGVGPTRTMFVSPDKLAPSGPSSPKVLKKRTVNPAATRHPKRAKPPRESAPPIPPDQLMTIQKAAAVLAVCEKTVRRWIGAGCLLPIRNGRSVRLRVRDVRDVRDLTRPE